MGPRFFLVAGGIGLVTTAFVIQACGETEPTPAAPVDSGADVAVADSGQKEAAPADEDAATCDPSADFTKQIPDASIADGASTSGSCLQCAQAKCKAQIDACNQDCDCQQLAAEGLDCYLKHASNPLVCASSFVGVSEETQNIGFALIGCLNSGCKDPCATNSFQPSDAGSDADAN